MSSDASWGAPGGSGVKNQPAHAGDTVSIPGSGRSPGGGNGHPLQASRLENPMDRGAWWATVHELTELVMAEQLRTGQQPRLLTASELFSSKAFPAPGSGLVEAL